MTWSGQVERLLDPPWRAVAAVALVVGVPLLVIGEITSADTRARLHDAQLDAAQAAADRGAALVNTRVGTLLKQVTSAAGQFELQNDVTARDPAAMRSDAANFARALGDDVAGVSIIDETGAVLSGPLAGPVPDREFFALARSAPRALVVPLESTAKESQRVVIAAPLRRAGTSFIGEVAVEVRLRDVAEWLQPGLGGFEDLYVVDARGRLLAQASRPGQPVRDLGIATAGASPAADRPDPLTGSQRIVAGAAAPDVGWTVIASRSADATERELSAVLTQLLVLRTGLVLVLLVVAYGFARVASQTLRQRRALAVANATLEERARELSQTNEALASATAAKSQFLANMSHDLRTPLNAIIGFSQLLISGAVGELDERQRDYVTDILGSGEHQLRLVNDILDLSKVEAGRMDLHPQDLSILELVEGAHAVVRPLAEAKYQTMVITGDAAPETVRHDPARLRQIVLNLLSNAIKYTPDRGTIRTRIARDTDEGFEIAVIDTGVGISATDLGRLFGDFERVGDRYSRQQQGTGLGLALVKRLSERMGGTVSVASELGVGSTFTLHLPVEQPSS